MKKSLIAALVGMLALLPSVTSAAVSLHWKNPGADPYIGTSQHALELLGKRLAIPAHVRAAMLPMLQTGEGCSQDEIPDGYVFDAMMYGKDIIKTNVVADTHLWPTDAPRTALMCKVRVGGVEYVLVRPVVCGNIAIKVIKIQDDCIPCPSCDEKTALTS